MPTKPAFSRRSIIRALLPMLGIIPVVSAGTFAVRDGGSPWHDRVGQWQMADVPAALQSDDPIPQQSCGSRGLAIPAGTKAIVMGSSAGDANTLVQSGIALRETDLQITIQNPAGTTKLPYPIFVLHDPPEEIGGKGICRSGLLLLRLNDEGIESRPIGSTVSPPKPLPEAAAKLVAPEKTLAERSRFHLYLLIGQSNMAGRGTIEAQDMAIHPRVLNLNKTGRWEVAQDPLHSDKPIAGVGLGKTFGTIMADKSPDAVIGLIPCAVGGTSISQWQKDAKPVPPWGELYNNAVARARIALHDGVLKGILWHQGEADSSPDKIAAYREKLSRMLAELRQELDAAHVPFVAGELGVWDPEKHANRRAFNENLATVSEWFDHAAVVSAKDLSDKGDQTHFSSQALRKFGARYAEAMLKLQEHK